MRIFSGSSHPKLANAICRYLGVDLGRIDVSKFPDSETKVQVHDNVRGLEAYVVQSLCAPVNESLMELLIIVDALRRASVKEIIAVIPYYAYARQDRKHAGRVPITAKLVANLLVTSGVNRILTMDLHASQIQGFFDIPVDHLYARPVHLQYIKNLGFENPVVMSPDVGSVKMAEGFARRIGGEIAVVEKRRVSDSNVETGHVIGDVKGRDVVICDDMITTAGSMSGAISVARKFGARRVVAIATHGVFCPPSHERITAAGPDEVAVTDTIPQTPPDSGFKLSVLSVAELLGEAITRIHRNKSVSTLFG